MTIVKKLTKIGNSYGVILPKRILQLVGVKPEEGCRITVEESRVTIEPAKTSKGLDERVAQAMLRFMKKYRSDLSRLGTS